MISTRAVSPVTSLREKYGLSRSALAVKLKLPTSLLRDAEDGVVFDAHRLGRLALAISDAGFSHPQVIIRRQLEWQKAALRISQLKYQRITANSQ